MNKGISYEREFSKSFHSNDVPFLISSKLLRKYHLGQIDIAKVELDKNKKIHKICLIELKYSKAPSNLQLIRLSKTRNYLSQLLDVETKFEIKLCKNHIDSLFY